MEAAEGRRAFLISKTWIQVVLLVVLFGFFVLGHLANFPAPTPSFGLKLPGRE